MLLQLESVTESYIFLFSPLFLLISLAVAWTNYNAYLCLFTFHECFYEPFQALTLIHFIPTFYGRPRMTDISHLLPLQRHCIQ